MADRTNLLDFTLPALTAWFAAQGEKPFRAKQVFRWICCLPRCRVWILIPYSRALASVTNSIGAE